MGKVADGLIEGMKFSKQVYIISDHYKEIADAIMAVWERRNRSAAKGMHSDETKYAFFCFRKNR
ncbi:MAG: hypothetical protein ACLVB3_09480 [Clostridium sp.]